MNKSIIAFLLLTASYVLAWWCALNGWQYAVWAAVNFAFWAGTVAEKGKRKP